MAIRNLNFTVGEADAGKRLDAFLAEALPQALGAALSKAKVRKLIVAGAVYLNRRRVRIAGKTLIVGAHVEVYIDLEKLNDDATRRDRAFAMAEARVLFEDEFLIAVDKPAGLPTQPTVDEARENLYAAVKRFLAQREGVTEVYLGLHHRLDRETSGVVVFTKRKEANAGLARSFAEHSIQKIYRAIALRENKTAPLPDEWTIENHLGKIARGGKKIAKFASVEHGGQAARTDFKLIEKLGAAVHVEARPLTGRTHQIRVHLVENGMPILGDDLYGGASRVRSMNGTDIVIARLMLHAMSLTFPHPVRARTEITIESPLLVDFTRCIAALKA